MQWSVFVSSGDKRAGPHNPCTTEKHTDVAHQVLFAIGSAHVAAVLLVVVPVHRLPNQVEAVQLVEDLKGCPVAHLAGARVGDLERVPRQAELVKLLL